MKKYVVIIEETVSEQFAVTADSEEDAGKIARERYNNTEFVLEPGNLTGRKMAVLSRDGEAAVWTEF
jgi:hypothetical protein